LQWLALGRLAAAAMAAGVSKTLWTMDDAVRMVEQWEGSRD